MMRKCGCHDDAQKIEENCFYSAMDDPRDAPNPHPEWKWPRHFGGILVQTPSKWGGHDEIPFKLVLDGRGYMLQFFEASDSSRGCGTGGCGDSRMCGGAGPRLVAQVNLDKTNIHTDVVTVGGGFGLFTTEKSILDLETDKGCIRMSFRAEEDMAMWWKAIAHTQHLARLIYFERTGNMSFNSKRGSTKLDPKESEVVEDLDEASMGFIGRSYEAIVGLVIRPPRAEYSMQQLGPTEFSFLGEVYSRQDFAVTNNRGMRLECSQWAGRGAPGPTLVYLHGNASCRLEALGVLSLCLSLGISLVAVDTGGSGMSEGNYVSLGYHEAQDAIAVIDFLRLQFKITDIGIMGRSMGAASSLLYASQYDPEIKCVIADSSFASLYRLFYDMVAKQAGGLAGIVTDVATNRIAATVQYRAKFDVYEDDPIEKVRTALAPAFLIHGKEDTLISPTHSDEIQKAYRGECEVHHPVGGHNSERPTWVYTKLSLFLSKNLANGRQPKVDLTAITIPDSLPLSAPQNPATYPPWAFTQDQRTGRVVIGNLGKGNVGAFRSGMTAERQAEAERKIGGMLGGR